MMRGKDNIREGKVWKQPDGYSYNIETKEISIDTNRSWIILTLMNFI